jgi:Contractile injection system tube protein/LysM domain
MERVTFVVESTGERLGCLLNPETLQVSRNAGVRRRRTATGLLAGAGISDDPLLYAGGGQTDLVLDLLFDIGIAGSTIQTRDVRDLTRPLWDLAESAAASAGATPPVVRFLWGKSWNIPGVVTAVAERLEQFQADGAPTRSWLRMRFVRVNESAAAEAATPQGTAPSLAGAGPEGEVVHQVVGGGSDAPGSGERLEDIAFLYYGDPSAWRQIAEANDIVDPSNVAPGTALRIPASAAAGGGL